MHMPRPISPILDGFYLEQPYSDHGAVQCCRVTERSSGDPFVLKMISLPSSAVQMDAMLISGAYRDRASANLYFKEQARDILTEAKNLRHLATLGGFADFDSVQVVPGPQEIGFEVYLLSPRRTSLAQIMAKPKVTQLEIVNMALDICAALTTCRHAGFFYANLKPSNIFCIGQHYRIGDLGFLPVSSLGNAPLPNQYRSSYTPPELLTGHRPITSSADTYALGMILYEAYNSGILPGEASLVGQLLAPPKYADYEMAEIILRACAPDPNIRWSDPEQMGYALARYLQRNGVHDCPIAPTPAPAPEPPQPQTPIEDFLPEQYDSLDFQIPLWEMEPQPVQTLPVRRRPAVRRRQKKKKRVGPVLVAVLAIILALELAVGAWLLLRPERIEINRFQASAGPDDRSVVIDISFEGNAPKGWILTYSAEGAEAQTVYFSGDHIQITDLTAGTSYTFSLCAQGDQRLTGQTQTTYSLP